jgi:hypothetical protein
MPKPPRPDKLPGPIRYKKPSGKPEDRPLERIHQEFEGHKQARKGAASLARGTGTRATAKRSRTKRRKALR